MARRCSSLSGGRLILWNWSRLERKRAARDGYGFPPDKVRLDQLEEAVQIIRTMWTKDAPSFQGVHYSIENAYCFPRPDPVPPLLIGGFGPKRTLKIVAKYADWCNINDSDLEFCRSRLDTLREHCLTVGRDYKAITKSYICDCVALARRTSRRNQRASFFSKYEPMVSTPDELADQIQAYAAWAQPFILRFADYPRFGVRLYRSAGLFG
jgi:alkanesulfonate monooxygenase SsuD/methylene tetrahydromethanopterin reductase-like flavin-dependent oxidoreductase (luciferase family)